MLCLPLLAVALGGCAGGTVTEAGPKRSAIWRNDVTLVLAGILGAADPVPGTVPDCPVLITDDGRIYAVIGDLSEFELGARVEIAGPPAIWSTCQTFQVVRADRVTRLH